MIPAPARLRVRVQPGAREDALVGRMADGTLKLRVRARALEGRANEAVEKLLAERLAVKRSQVRVARGGAARLKSVEIAGLGPAELEARIETALAAATGRDGSRGT